MTGGKRADVEGLDDGYFVEPTIFTDVTNDMTIAREEIFGPVTCVLPWKDEDQVIGLANDSDYGLGGGIFCGDIGRAHRMARAMQTGTVWINRFYNFQAGQSLGGYKQSGFGREGCAETLLHYTQTKSVVVNLVDGPLGLYGAG